MNAQPSVTAKADRAQPGVVSAAALSPATDARGRYDTSPLAPGQKLIVAYASQTGFIEEIVETTNRDLASIGVSTELVELDDLDIRTLERTTPILFMTSTTGSGDAPFAAELFSDHTMADPAPLAHLRFGLLCAGDRGYENFCGFGHRLRDWLLVSGARPLFEPVDVDCEDERAVARWRDRVLQAFSSAAACTT